MATHAKDAQGCSGISEVVNLALAIAAAEAGGAEGLIAGKDSEVLNLVSAGTAAVGAVVADEGPVAEEEEVGIGVEEDAAGVAAKAVEVPSVTGYRR